MQWREALIQRHWLTIEIILCAATGFLQPGAIDHLQRATKVRTDSVSDKKIFRIALVRMSNNHHLTVFNIEKISLFQRQWRQRNADCFSIGRSRIDG